MFDIIREFSKCNCIAYGYSLMPSKRLIMCIVIKNGAFLSSLSGFTPTVLADVRK